MCSSDFNSHHQSHIWILLSNSAFFILSESSFCVSIHTASIPSSPYEKLDNIPQRVPNNTFIFDRNIFHKLHKLLLDISNPRSFDCSINQTFPTTHSTKKILQDSNHADKSFWQILHFQVCNHLWWNGEALNLWSHMGFAYPQHSAVPHKQSSVICW